MQAKSKKPCILGQYKQRYRTGSSTKWYMPRTPKNTKCKILDATRDSRPWQIVATDLFHFNGSNYMLIVRIPLCEKIEWVQQPSGNPSKQMFGEQGFPERVISDNGRHYNSFIFKHLTSSPKYPQSNGLAERRVQTIKSAIKKATSSDRDLDWVLLCLWKTPIDYVIPSAGELLSNRKLVGNIPVKCANHSAKKK